MADNREKLDAIYSEPVVVKNMLGSWEPLSWTLESWKEKINRTRLAVRIGELDPKYTHPQWERFTKVKTVPIDDLFSSPQYRSGGEWMYFDYNYMREIFPAEVLGKFDWSVLGLQGRDGSDSTLWIGSKGSHTPCHQDSYGYNLVAQMYGTKSWILISPQHTERLMPTRVPYEESSVYSGINFKRLSANPTHILERLRNVPVHMVTLEPGDVLYVPRKWWHFVQNQSFAISVNTWVECPEDDEARLEEALVRVQAATLAQSLSRDEAKLLLNPNEDDLIDADINKLADLTLDITKHVQRGERCAQNWPRFGDAAVRVDPTLLDIPETGLPDNSSPAHENPQFRLFNLMTSQSVISLAAESIKSSHS